MRKSIGDRISIEESPKKTSVIIYPENKFSRLDVHFFGCCGGRSSSVLHLMDLRIKSQLKDMENRRIIS